MPPTQHARLGGSKAKRWINCTASVQLESQFPDESNEYAREGTAAHELAERCLRGGSNAEDHIGDVIVVPYTENGEPLGDKFPVTEEMAEAAQVFVDHVRGLVQGGPTGAKLFVEQRFDLSPLDPPGPMYGTADAVVWDPDSRVLHVCDYKHGRGVAVDAVNNDQLTMYALGAVVELRKKPKDIVLTIVQPRAPHPDGPVRSDHITFATLQAWKAEAWAAADEAVNSDDPTFEVGDWCRFCKAQAICPAQRATAMAVAQTEFDALPVDEEPELPAVEQLSMEQILAVLDHKKLIENWLRAIHDHVVNELDRGVEVPGYKLVEGRSHRRWTDEEEADRYLASKGLRQAQRLKMDVISPAQAEKALKRAGVDLSRLRKLDELIYSPEGKPKLVREDHPAPALPPSAATEFDVPSD